jgi:CMP-N-acetylneuraminic acid synthetase
MNFLGIIPARAGSKSIKNKNIVKLNGKPLIYYTITAAKKSILGDNFIVSTDDPKIIKICKELKVKYFFKRPIKFSSDKTTAIELLKYLVKDLEKKKFKFKNIVYLQPTSPFRNSLILDKAIKTYKKNLNIDSLISISEVESNHPARMKFMNKNNILIDNYYTEKKEGLNKQELKKMYIRNGAIYIFKKKNLKSATIKGKKSYGFLMSGNQSINIDGVNDLNYAKFLINQNPKILQI